MINIAILGAAEIAHRMFLPALLENPDFRCLGVASNTKEKREKFRKDFAVNCFDNYEDILNNSEVDAVYIPLPPALHYEWAKKALEANKHVLLEKPSTINLKYTKELVQLAQEKGLVLQENYMFQYHSQLKFILDTIAEGRIGEIRLIRSNFGFPLREANDFRYNKLLGGGALLDAGGYVVKLGNIMLGDTARVETASVGYLDGYSVDMYGSFTMLNENNVVYQGAYGMDCYYQCSLEVLGSRGRIYTNRIYTAPPNLKPLIIIEDGNGKEEISLKEDRHFSKSIKMFYNAIHSEKSRCKMYNDLLRQSSFVQNIMEIGGGK